MPVAGGSADKLGNIYEGFWVIDHLLQIVEGTVETLVYESLDKLESQGIEFVVIHADKRREHWSIKRQTTQAAGWTLSLLTKEERGRSILGDLFAHVIRATENHGVFASTQGAGDLAELCEYAQKDNVLFTQRIAQSAKLKAEFDKRIKPLFGGATNQAVAALQKIHVRTIDEEQLCFRTDTNIRKLFYHPDGKLTVPSAIRGHFADLLRDRIHQIIDRDIILNALQNHGVHLKNWLLEQDKVAHLRENYVQGIRAQWMTNTLVSLGQEKLLDEASKPVGRKILT